MVRGRRGRTALRLALCALVFTTCWGGAQPAMAQLKGTATAQEAGSRKSTPWTVADGGTAHVAFRIAVAQNFQIENDGPSAVEITVKSAEREFTVQLASGDGIVVGALPGESIIVNDAPDVGGSGGQKGAMGRCTPI